MTVAIESTGNVKDACSLFIAERDTDVSTLSVCPMPVLRLHERTYRHSFWWSDRGPFWFLSLNAVTKFQGNPLGGALNTQRCWENFAMSLFIWKTVRD